MEHTNPYKSAEPGRLERIAADILKNVRLNKGFILWMGFLVVAFAVCLYAYTVQLRKGLIVTGLRDYTSWGMYIANFVFFVATSLIGMLIGSVLGLIGFKWITPIARIAEIIAVAFAAVAGLVIIMDMGRPDRLPYVFMFGRVQSPILWDVTVVTSYFLISFLLYFIPMIPDLALAKTRIGHTPKSLQQIYNLLSFKWIHTNEQYKILFRAIRVLLILIVPMALAIHTVTSWLFAFTLRAGWDSTIFGPYFVSGAFVSGTAAVIIAMFFFRHSYKLKAYLTPDHFDKIARLLGLLAIVYLYFNINEFLVPGYKMKKFEAIHLKDLLYGAHALLFWGTQLFGLIIPIILLFFRPMRKPLPVTIIAIFVFAGSWLKRFIIVVPAQNHPFLPKQNVPAEWMVYTPTLIETAVVLLSLILVLIIITVLSKTFPVLPIVELAAEDDGGPQTTDGRNTKAEVTPEKKDHGRQFATGEFKSTDRGRRMSVGILLFLLSTTQLSAQTWTVPDDKKARLSDIAFTDEMRKSGAQVFLINCKSCHGDPGRNNVTKLIPPPPDPVSRQMQDNSDGELYYKIQEGRAPMPSFKNALTSAEIWQVISYIRSFNKDYVQKLSAKPGTNQRYSLVKIDLSVAADTVIQASVTGMEKDVRVPVPGVEVALMAHRYFGHLRLDEPRTTDNSGVARFRAPLDLPADTAGIIRFIARLTDEAQFGAVEKDTTFKLGVRIHPVGLNAHRAMWNTVRKAPVWLLIVFPAAVLTLLGLVLYILLSIRTIFYIGKREEEKMGSLK